MILIACSPSPFYQHRGNDCNCNNVCLERTSFNQARPILLRLRQYITRPALAMTKFSPPRLVFLLARLSYTDSEYDTYSRD